MAMSFGTLNSLCILMIMFFVFSILTCFEASFVEAQVSEQQLPQEEKKALEEIAHQLGKKHWDFKYLIDSSCDEEYVLELKQSPKNNNSVICSNCSFPGGVCHIESIFLTGQDLDGVLPPSLANLPYIKSIDLTRNYLQGTIPPEWKSTKLEYLSVTVNRLSGPIPKYLGSITTLKYLSLENNLFNESVPAELGKLVNLENLTLSVNYLTGQLPSELSNLSKLISLRLNSNNFSGKLPNFQSWKQLRKLEIVAGGFEGPIPPSISVLSNLTDLVISDLNGGGSEFPQLQNMAGMATLMLRRCNISGTIPAYIANMKQLKILDLSFNKLEGQIPNLEDLSKLENVILTSNSLTGWPTPNWIESSTNTNDKIDLSYNNFSKVPSTCRETLNLFRSNYGGNNS